VPEVELYTAAPTILATSKLMIYLKPRHAAKAALTDHAQLDRQTSHSQYRAAYRRALPLTQFDFYQRRQQPTK
jgi:hypothetical protein